MIREEALELREKLEAERYQYHTLKKQCGKNQQLGNTTGAHNYIRAMWARVEALNEKSKRLDRAVARKEKRIMKQFPSAKLNSLAAPSCSSDDDDDSVSQQSDTEEESEEEEKKAKKKAKKRRKRRRMREESEEECEEREARVVADGSAHDSEENWLISPYERTMNQLFERSIADFKAANQRGIPFEAMGI